MAIEFHGLFLSCRLNEARCTRTEYTVNNNTGKIKRTYWRDNMTCPGGSSREEVVETLSNALEKSEEKRAARPKYY